MLSVSSHITVDRMVGLALMLGTGDAVFIPTSTSIVPSLVPEEHLVQVNSLTEFVNPLAYTLLGPFLGGITIGAVGVGWALAADSATFAFSALTVAMIRHRRLKATDHSSVLEDVREGFRFVRRTRWFWIGLASTSTAVFATVGALTALLPFLVKEELGASAFALGGVYAAGGVGAMAVAFVMGQHGRLLVDPLTAYYIAWTISCAFMALFGVVFHVWQAVLIAGLCQAASAVQNVLWFTVQYRLVPEKMLGRVSSLDWTISLAGLPLSYAIDGPLASAVGTRAALIVTGLAGAVAMAVPVFVPGALRPERDGSLSTPPALDKHATAT